MRRIMPRSRRSRSIEEEKSTVCKDCKNSYQIETSGYESPRGYKRKIVIEVRENKNADSFHDKGWNSDRSDFSHYSRGSPLRKRRSREQRIGRYSPRKIRRRSRNSRRRSRRRRRTARESNFSDLDVQDRALSEKKNEPERAEAETQTEEGPSSSKEPSMTSEEPDNNSGGVSTIGAIGFSKSRVPDPPKNLLGTIEFQAGKLIIPLLPIIKRIVRGVENVENLFSSSGSDVEENTTTNTPDGTEKTTEDGTTEQVANGAAEETGSKALEESPTEEPVNEPEVPRVASVIGFTNLNSASELLADEPKLSKPIIVRPMFKKLVDFRNCAGRKVSPGFIEISSDEDTSKSESNGVEPGGSDDKQPLAVNSGNSATTETVKFQKMSFYEFEKKEVASLETRGRTMVRRCEGKEQVKDSKGKAVSKQKGRRCGNNDKKQLQQSCADLPNIPVRTSLRSSHPPVYQDMIYMRGKAPYYAGDPIYVNRPPGYHY